MSYRGRVKNGVVVFDEPVEPRVASRHGPTVDRKLM